MEIKNQTNEYDQDCWPDLGADEERDLWLEQCWLDNGITQWEGDRIAELEENEINLIMGKVA